MSQHNEEHVSLWHPWKDKPGARHKLALWSDFPVSSVEETIQRIGNGQLYCVCNDILDSSEVPVDLVRHDRTTGFISRTGSCVALQVRHKRRSGFLIPSQVWGSTYPNREVLERMEYVFQRFGYEALTPASLSEKVLRGTLPERSYISRPSHMLRSSLLKHSKGGRIDKKEISQFYPSVYENDLNKAYLYIAGQGVPDPRIAPIRMSDGWQDYPTAWMSVHMTCHRGDGTQPVQIRDAFSGELREPFDGEEFEDWLWSGEIRDCMEAGYTLNHTYEGWAWACMSNFLRRWSDILWDAYQGETDEHIKDIEKSMMVGFPGRCLRRPEKYTLVHKSERQPGDELLVAKWMNGSSPMSDWYMRTEEDIESTALTPIGEYVIAECRRKLYHDCLSEERRGNVVARIYIDSLTTVNEPQNIKKGHGRGEYKTKIYTQVVIDHGRFKGYNERGELVLKAPGIEDTVERQRIVERMIVCLEPP